MWISQDMGSQQQGVKESGTEVPQLGPEHVLRDHPEVAAVRVQHVLPQYFHRMSAKQQNTYKPREQK